MRTDAKPIFLDTNILLAATDTSRSAHTDCHALLESGFKGTCSLFTNAQVFREYLVVATRPHEVNGLGMDPIQALENIASFQQCIQILEETVQVSNRLLKLVATHKLTGKRIHDANIVATMLENGITRLVTLNPSDFSCFDTLSVEAP